MQPHHQKPPAPSRQRRFFEQCSQPAALALLLALLTLAIYWPATRSGFVNLDDPVYVSERPQVVTGINLDNLRWAVTSTAGGNWHPLTWWSLMLDGQMYGSRPGGYHFINLVLHTMNTLLLFGWLHAVTGARWRSAVVAALFALHPLHVESVAWISARKDVVSTAFWLWTVWAYTQYARKRVTSTRPWRWYTLSLVLFLLGLMSKPMLVTLPFVLLLLDYWPLKRFASGSAAWSLLREKIPFLLLSLGASVLAVRAQQSSAALASWDLISPGARVANALVSYVRYLGKTCWPADLAVFYPYPTNWPLAVTLGAALLILLLCGIVVQLRHRHPFLAMGWFWFLGTLVPVIGLVQVGGQSLADRYTYVPLIGLFIALVWGAEALLRTGPRILNSPATAPAILTCLVLLGCGVVTSRQLRHWQDSETLFRHAVAVTHGNAVAHVNLAAALLDQNRFTEAAAHSRRALEIRPDSAEALKNLGLALAGLGQWHEALRHYQHALQLNPADDQALNGLGLALANQGQLNAAAENFRRALDHQPNSAEALSNLGLTLALLGQLDEAVACHRRALALKPREAKVLNNLGLALAGQHHWADALECYRQALELNPRYVDALVNSGAAHSGQGEPEQAIQCYRQALDLKPDSWEALYNLGRLLVRQGRREEAIPCLSAALRLQPDHPKLREQLRALGVPTD